ncbi:hypothetical protein A2U01_0087716 [Trifolium medium]|uniref:Uncharacterized protein n=1 Tax=Trifolium medium TaxID=97028 RepID=A0A392U009_9FABA|nr:hypothetical protein [Trifolium medium]
MGVGAARRQGFRKLEWFWTLRNAQPWMAQRATLRAGVAWPLSFARRACAILIYRLSVFLLLRRGF